MDNTQLLEKLKRRLGITDTLEDELLNDIINDAIDHFKLITKAVEVNSKYSFIILDVADIRYNRKGSAGMKSEATDGYSVSFQTISDDFKPYMAILNADFEIGSESQREKGKIGWY